MAVDVEIWDGSTYFEAGSTLVLEVGAHELSPYPVMSHEPTRNVGVHIVHSGPQHDSWLELPIARATK